MDRVDYHLERLLPSLQLLTHLHLFTHLELQSLTQKRRNHELHLISKNVSLPHYLEYIALEEDIEKLTSLRVARSGKDEQGNEVVTLKDRNKLRRFQERQLLSVWQRMVTKLGPRDPAVFQRYLTWLQARKMRRVYSQIAAQALSLHPSSVPLWICVADWELNANLDASAARLTLLRAIRLNTVTQSDAKRRAARKEKEGRRRKRARRVARGQDGSDSDDDEEADSEDEDEQQSDVEGDIDAQPSTSMVPLTLPAAITPSSRDLLTLWLAYFRMECVFLERLRRRWALLGIAGGDAAKSVVDEAQKESSIEQEDGNSEDEAAASARPAPSLSAERSDAQASAANESAKATAPTKILSGALPLAIFSAALNPAGPLSTSSSSTPSLPHNLKLVYALLVLRLLLSFPFETRNNADGESLRSSLLSSILATLDSLAATAASSRTADLVRRITLSISAARFAAYRRLVAEDEESRPQEDVDKRRNEELSAAARLAVHGERGEEQVQELLSASVPEEDEDDVEKPAQDVPGDHPLHALLAQLVKDVRRTQAYAHATMHKDTANQTRIGLANAVKALLSNASDLDAATRITLGKAIWRSLAYQEAVADEAQDEENAKKGGLQATRDPLLPYVTALLERALSKQRKSSASHSAASLLFSRQVLQHETDLLSTAGGPDGEELQGKWEKLDELAVQTLSGLVPRDLFARAAIWTSRWTFEQFVRNDGNEGTSAIVEQLQSANDFWLTSLRSLTPSKSASTDSSDLAATSALFIATQVLPWVRAEREEGRALYTEVVEKAVQLSRKHLLVARAESAEAREKLQGCHDGALLCLFELGGEEEEQNVLQLWKDSSQASPSLAAWTRLLPLLQGDANILAAAQHVERMALQHHQRAGYQHKDELEVSREADLLLDVFTALFETYLKQGDVAGGVGLLQKAKRVGGGSEAWERSVEERWTEAGAAFEQ
ncbi:hypothetical protein BDZ90DRAFT_232186 [Jaminaea rosea]|uniref:U3 small nucleolar RNA-associated protein 6 N-terminal domain-containing protein n=1 Tax=Jaminaea rosea TaxID=1569628 RepID=A0A316UR58_9BASI|nr:hypothetical protein BDZ90DRAFT_232186 [Jaminaea rosea]PWN27799.1 hypothetical protein BDZ90DRAFT_232186 [Jaminaea rosea]